MPKARESATAPSKNDRQVFVESLLNINNVSLSRIYVRRMGMINLGLIFFLKFSGSLLSPRVFLRVHSISRTTQPLTSRSLITKTILAFKA